MQAKLHPRKREAGSQSIHPTRGLLPLRPLCPPWTSSPGEAPAQSPQGPQCILGSQSPPHPWGLCTPPPKHPGPRFPRASRPRRGRAATCTTGRGRRRAPRRRTRPKPSCSSCRRRWVAPPCSTGRPRATSPTVSAATSARESCECGRGPGAAGGWAAWGDPLLPGVGVSGEGETSCLGYNSHTLPCRPNSQIRLCPHLYTTDPCKVYDR